MPAEEKKLLRSFLPGLLFVGLLCFIHFLAWLTELDLAGLGVFPRHRKGILGIVTAPLIHADLLHLLSNSFPLVLLSAFLFFYYRRLAVEVWVWVYLITGFWTFLFARQNYHIGASGVVYGLASFLLFIGLFRRDRNSISLSAIILILYGGLVYGVLPIEAGVSWESHLFGALAGVIVAFYFRNNQIPEEKPPQVPLPDIPHERLYDPFSPWNLTPPEVWVDPETFWRAHELRQQRDNPPPPPQPPAAPISGGFTGANGVSSTTPYITFRYVLKGPEEEQKPEPEK